MVDTENKDMPIENEVKEVKKKRGRPKKEEQKIEEQVTQEPEKEKAEIKVPEQEIIEQPMQEEKKLPLTDGIDFPEKVELTDEEEINIEDVKDIKPEKKDKTFWEKFFNNKKVDKPNTVAILLLRINGEATPLYREYDEEGMFRIDDIKKNPFAKTYHIRHDCIHRIKIKKDTIPLCILPEWSLVPLGNRIYWEMGIERRAMEAQEEFLKAIRAEEVVKQDESLKKKSAISGKTIWIFIAIVVIGYLFWKGTGH